MPSYHRTATGRPPPEMHAMSHLGVGKPQMGAAEPRVAMPRRGPLLSPKRLTDCCASRVRIVQPESHPWRARVSKSSGPAKSELCHF